MSGTPDPETLRALGQVQGQLNGIADLIRETSAATNRRIDDLKETMDDRFQDHGERISRLENNERATAIKAAAIGATAGAASGVVGQVLGAIFRFKTGS